MKNAIIATVEEYECMKCADTSSACFKKIEKEAEKLAYSPTIKIKCPGKFKNVGNLFCIKRNVSYKTKVSYHIITQVDLNIPIVNHITGLSLFQINGDTRELPKNNCSI